MTDLEKKTADDSEEEMRMPASMATTDDEEYATAITFKVMIFPDESSPELGLASSLDGEDGAPKLVLRRLTQICIHAMYLGALRCTENGVHTFM
ncbi:hypothetical protein ACLOJK_037027 [Asimina triloba]